MNITYLPLNTPDDTRKRTEGNDQEFKKLIDDEISEEDKYILNFLTFLETWVKNYKENYLKKKSKISLKLASKVENETDVYSPILIPKTDEIVKPDSQKNDIKITSINSGF